MSALIYLLFRLIVLLGLLGVGLAVLGAVFRVAGAVLRALAMLAVSLGVPLAVGAFVAALAGQNPALDAGLSGLLAGGLSLPVALWAARDMFGGSLRRPDTAPEARQRAPARAPASPTAPPPEPAADRAVAGAWSTIGRLLPSATEELEERRAAVAAVLHATDAGSLDPTMIDIAVAVRRHLPALAEQGGAMIADAGPQRGDDAATELLASVRDLTDAALAQRDGERRRRQQSWATLRAHLRGRTGRG